MRGRVRTAVRGWALLCGVGWRSPCSRSHTLCALAHLTWGRECDNEGEVQAVCLPGSGQTPHACVFHLAQLCLPPPCCDGQPPFPSLGGLATHSLQESLPTRPAWPTPTPLSSM